MRLRASEDSAERGTDAKEILKDAIYLNLS
jgi:hypothetical protein